MVEFWDLTIIRLPTMNFIMQIIQQVVEAPFALSKGSSEDNITIDSYS